MSKALFSPFFATGDEQPNSARYTFLAPRAPEFLRDWEKAADDTVAILRAQAGRDPYERNLSDLIGELSTRSEEFRTRWASHDVRIHATGTKRLHHPVVGDLDLSYESFPMPDQDQSLLIYVAEPGTPSHDALRAVSRHDGTAATDSSQSLVLTTGHAADSERPHVPERLAYESWPADPPAISYDQSSLWMPTGPALW